MLNYSGNIDYTNAVAEIIKYERKIRNLTIEELSAETGISETVIQKIEQANWPFEIDLNDLATLAARFEYVNLVMLFAEIVNISCRK